MAITVVQTSVNGTNFTSPVAAGNSIILLHTSFSSTSGATLGSSNPLYNGSTPAGSVKLIEQNSPNTPNVVYSVLWLLPNVAGGGTTFGITDSGAGVSDLNLSGIELNGLGTAPQADAAGGVSSAGGTGTSGSSGATPALANQPAFVVGQSIWFGQTVTGPGAPWTALVGDTHQAMGYQIVTSTGTGYTFTSTAPASANWADVVAAVTAAPPPAAHVAAGGGRSMMGRMMRMADL